jgi:hypothetical protein
MRTGLPFATLNKTSSLISSKSRMVLTPVAHRMIKAQHQSGSASRFEKAPQTVEIGARQGASDRESNLGIVLNSPVFQIFCNTRSISSAVTPNTPATCAGVIPYFSHVRIRTECATVIVSGFFGKTALTDCTTASPLLRGAGTALKTRGFRAVWPIDPVGAAGSATPGLDANNASAARRPPLMSSPRFEFDLPKVEAA